MKSEEVSLIKGIGIFCVVLGHACVQAQPFVSMFHLAIFFWSAGFTYNYSKYGDNVALLIGTRLHKFMIPYIGYMLILMLCHNIFYYMGIMDEGIRLYKGADYITAFFGYFTLNFESFSGPVWFISPFLISTILMGNIVYFMKIRYVKNITKIWNGVLIISWVLGIVGVFLVDKGFQTGYRYELALVMLPIMVMGKIANMYYQRVKKSINFIGALFAIGIVIVPYLYSGKFISLGSGELLSPYIFYIITFSGIYFVLWLVKMLLYILPYYHKIFCTLGDYSLDIMILHIVFFRIIYGLSNYSKGYKQDYATFVFSNSIICLVVGIIFPIMVRKVAQISYQRFLNIYIKT